MMAVTISCFCVTASAESFYQGGDVITGGTFAGDTFSMGNNNRLTVAARAVTKAGTPTGVTVYVQKYGTYGWSTIASDTIAMDTSEGTHICIDADVDRNTSCRIVCIVNGSGANVATVHLGIGMWEKL